MNLEQKYADILNTVTNIQQAAQSTTLARKHQVLGDYALLGSVGQLVGSRIWRLNELGYQSVSRQGFTTWVMQALLPSIWDQFRVTGCDNQLEVACTPPPNGPNMQSYGGGNFTGVLPKQSPCSQACGKHACVTICSWTDLSPDAAHLVFAPIATKCTYSPGDGGSWIYPANGTPGGCSLGAASALFSNSGGWKLQTNQINVGGGTVGATITGGSAAVNLNDVLLHPQLRLQMFGPLKAPIDLRTTRLQVNRLLREIGGSEELVKDSVGNAFIPLALLPQQATEAQAVFETLPGQTPRMSAIVQSKPGVAVGFDLTVDSASIADPQLCVGTPPTTARLHVLLQVSGGGLPQPVNFEQVEDWECVTDAQGTLRMLRPAGTPAWRLNFQP